MQTIKYGLRKCKTRPSRHHLTSTEEQIGIREHHNAEVHKDKTRTNNFQIGKDADALGPVSKTSPAIENGVSTLPHTGRTLLLRNIYALTYIRGQQCGEQEKIQ